MKLFGRTGSAVLIAGGVASVAAACKCGGNASDTTTTRDASSSVSSCTTPAVLTVDVSVRGAGNGLALMRTRYPFAPAAVTLRVDAPCAARGDAAGIGLGIGIGTEDERSRFVLRLPRFPGVVFEDPKELCSAEVIARKLEVDCLSDEGALNHVSIDLDPLLHDDGAPNVPFVVENHVGVRDMHRVLKAYADARGDCPQPERRPIAVTLQLDYPREGSLRVDRWLHAPELGVHRSLGFTTAIGPCAHAPLQSRPGVCGGCWTDEGWGGALVYQVGRTLFHHPSSVEASAAVGTIELPCGRQALVQTVAPSRMKRFPATDEACGLE